MPYFWQRCTLETWHRGVSPTPLTGRKASRLMCIMHSFVPAPRPLACTEQATMQNWLPVACHLWSHVLLISQFLPFVYL